MGARSPEAPGRAGWACVLTAIACAAAGSCVRVERRYLDGGPDSPGDAGPGIGAEATRAVLASVAERVILPALRDAEARAVTLVTTTEAYARTGGATDREAAQDAWRALMHAWQRVEMLQVGPAGLPSITPGGRGMRDDVYGWPLFGRCRIDQATVAATHADMDALRAASLDTRGLGAIEYLLFFGGPDNGCGPTATINVDGSWAALGPVEVTHRRAVYAHTAAVIVAEAVTRIRDAWEPGIGGFATDLATAGAGSATFPTSQAGLNALSDALFYLYREVLDLKLGIPAGLRMECLSTTCPDRVESTWAGASLDEVRANLEAFRDAYLGAPEGTDGAGFDDLLRSIGAADLDARITAAIAATFVALDAIDGSLEAALASDLSAVVALHDAGRALADLFKVEVLTLLDLELPMRLEGDND